MINSEFDGYFYEDLLVGDTIEHDVGRTVTQADNSFVEKLTAYSHPLHSDETYAKKTEFANITLNGIGTFAIVSGMSSSLLGKHVITTIEWTDVKFLNPVYIGDKLSAKNKVIFKRESKSRPNQGIVYLQTIGMNQHNNPVISFNRIILIKRKYLSQLMKYLHICI